MENSLGKVHAQNFTDKKIYTIVFNIIQLLGQFRYGLRKHKSNL